MAIVGFDCKLYRNTGTYASPTWGEIKNVGDATLNLDSGDAEASTRASQYREYAHSIKDISVEFDSVWDGSDTDFQALLNAWINRTNIELLVLDGSSATAGKQGIRATFKVQSCSRSEALADTVKAAFVLKPVRNSDAAPAWYTVSA